MNKTHGPQTCTCASKAGPCTGNCVCPTQFPAVISMGASFDRSLWRSVGQAIGKEARALYAAKGKGLEGLLGLGFYAPNVNILRDPRWGRAEEVPGEGMCVCVCVCVCMYVCTRTCIYIYIYIYIYI